MAPVTLDTVNERTKEVIQSLFEIQSAVHGYIGPETQQTLIRKISTLTTSLSTLSATASALPTQIPPELIDYLEDGRNPDIYTREFVELVQKGNQDLKAKSEAFAGYRDVLAEEILMAMPEMKGDVEMVLAGRKRDERERAEQNGEMAETSAAA